MRKWGCKKRVIKLLAMLLSGIVLLTGCGGQEEGKKTDNGVSDDGNTLNGGVQIVEPEEPVLYVAAYTSLGIPAGSYGFHKSGNAIYAIVSDYSAKENHFYKEVIGNNTSALELMTTSAIYEEVVENSLHFHVDEDGYLYFILVEAESGEEVSYDGMCYYLVKSASGGRELLRTDITQQIGASYKAGDPFQNMTVDAEGRVYLATSERIYLYDENLVCQGDIKEEGLIESIGRGKDGMVYYTRWQENTATESILDLMAADPESRSAALICSGFPEQSMKGNLTAGVVHDFIINDGKSLYGFNIEEGTAERLLSWNEHDVRGEVLAYACELAEGEFLAVELGLPMQKVLISKRPEGETPSDREILTIGVMVGSLDMLQGSEMIARFNRSQEKYQVEIVVYGEEDEISVNSISTEYRKGMEDLTLDLVSGKGPDLIYYNSNFPIYARRGILEDLNDYLERSEVLSREDYLESALSIYTFSGKLTVLPATLELMTCYAYTDLVGEGNGRSLSEYLKLLEKYPEMKLFRNGYNDWRDEVRDLSELMYSFVDWENGTCDFESEEFRGLLEYLNSFDSEGKEGDFLLHNDYGISLYTTILNMEMEAGERGVTYTYTGYPTREGSGIYLIGRSPGNSYSIGISSQSKNKEGAWEFLEYMHGRLLRENYERLINNPTMPLAGDGFPAQTAYLERYLGGFVGNSYETFSIVTGEHGMSEEVSSEDLEWVLEALENAEPPSTFLYSGVVYDILFEEIGSYIAGDKTADEVMDIIQRRVGLYLSENY